MGWRRARVTADAAMDDAEGTPEVDGTAAVVGGVLMVEGSESDGNFTAFLFPAMFLMSESLSLIALEASVVWW